MTTSIEASGNDWFKIGVSLQYEGTVCGGWFQLEKRVTSWVVRVCALCSLVSNSINDLVGQCRRERLERWRVPGAAMWPEVYICLCLGWTNITMLGATPVVLPAPATCAQCRLWGPGWWWWSSTHRSVIEYSMATGILYTKTDKMKSLFWNWNYFIRRIVL